MDVAEPLVRYIVNTRYEDIPLQAIEFTKQNFLHTIGVIIAGSSSDGCKAVVDLASEWGGKEESTILVFGNKVPAINAVLANGVMAHALDFDANDDRRHYKPSTVTVPASLNVSELKGGVTGKEMLTALCLGLEVGTRIALGVSLNSIRTGVTHAHSRLIAGFAVASVAGKILGLNEEEMLDAFGLAFCEVSPTGSSAVSPALTKRLKLGLAGRAGVFSALLARKGFKSVRDIFQGKEGLYYTYWGDEGNLEKLTDGLGERFEMLDGGIKAYPCARSLQNPIYITLLLVNEYDIKPDDIAEVKVYMGTHDPGIRRLNSDPEALERSRHPKGLVDAQFSFPWGVATAILKRKVFIEDFGEQAREDKRLISVAEKVTPIGDPELKIEDVMVSPTIVEIKTNDGQVYSRRVDFPKGNPKNPVTMEETRETFRRCADYAARPLPKGNVEKAIEMIDALEKVGDVSVLSRLFTA